MSIPGNANGAAPPRPCGPMAWLRRKYYVWDRNRRFRALRRFRRKVADAPFGQRLSIGPYKVRVTDGANAYIQYKDEFFHRIYHFRSDRPDPLILDGGGNIGMSVLYAKSVYPDARVIAFEPDPKVFSLLQENVDRNGLTDVRLINAALGERAGEVGFAPDGSAGGAVDVAGGSVTVRVETLSSYLEDRVDFLKLNIEGQELAVLREAAAAGKLRNVRRLVLEYHGWTDSPQNLGDILNLLDREGYRYLIHDFDVETGPATKPPFEFRPGRPWFCLVYAEATEDREPA